MINNYNDQTKNFNHHKQDHVFMSETNFEKLKISDNIFQAEQSIILYIANYKPFSFRKR